jgi:succinate dehydrogenase / fumarate reductase cytochrome b subunit
MSRLLKLSQSTLGKKAIVAATGVVLFGFVVLHMLGNLKTFTGRDADGTHHIDVYARFLREMGEPMVPREGILWVTRVVLLVALVVHVVTVIQLVRLNRAARPIGYQRRTYAQSTVPARTMLASGLLLLGFVVVHILHFTTGTIDVRPIVHEQVYANLYHSFRAWFIVAFYVTAMILLALHLYHGVWSLFQTLGWDNPDRNRGLRALAVLAAIGLLVGFSSVPVLIFLGVMPEPPATLAAEATGGH